MERFETERMIEMLEIKILCVDDEEAEPLDKLCREVVNENYLEATIEIVMDYKVFEDYGVGLTPALVVNEQVLISGKLPSKTSLTCWMLDLQNQDAIDHRMPDGRMPTY